MPSVIADTGPLVALLDRADRHHRWAKGRVQEANPPLLVCEPVVTESMYLLARIPTAQDALFGLIERGALSIAFRIDAHLSALHQLHQKYRDRPMSLADACIVRMAEIHDRHAVLTLDSDFLVYRKHGRVPLTIIHPTANS
jgi:predicted nucleic acid-binding protein